MSTVKLSQDYRYVMSVRREFGFRHTPSRSCYIVHVPNSSLTNVLFNSQLNCGDQMFHQQPCVQSNQLHFHPEAESAGILFLLHQSNLPSIHFFNLSNKIFLYSVYKKHSSQWILSLFDCFNYQKIFNSRIVMYLNEKHLKWLYKYSPPPSQYLVDTALVESELGINSL